MVGLKVLLSASLCISWQWTAHSEEVKKLHPGESGFWVQLDKIESSAGKLEPAFKPDTNDYTLIIDDDKTESIEISLELMLEHYYPDEPPKIQVDGEDLLFNPFRGVSFKVPTDKSKGPLDKKVEVRVSDPHPAKDLFGQGKTTENTYNIRVLQKPPAQATEKNTVEPSDLLGAITSSSERLLKSCLVCSVAALALFAAVVVHRRSRIISHHAILPTDGLMVVE